MKLKTMESYVLIWESDLFLNDYTQLPEDMIDKLYDYFYLAGGSDREFNETYTFGTNSIEENEVVQLIEQEYQFFNTK